jgi:amphi-Trp domain-containing protein
MASRRNRDIERTYSRAQFVAKLRRLADAIEAERPFVIQVAGERLHVPADTAFNIEHERAGGEDELELQVRWRSADAGARARRARGA